MTETATRRACPIRDLSDKGRKATRKRLRYEVLMYETPAASNGLETPLLCARFISYGDAFAYAANLATAPIPTEVLIRS